MQVRISGALKVRSAAAGEAALEAFDRESYPEFFTADIWQPAGRFLVCDTEFELAADCDPMRAIRTIVGLSTDGIVECHLSGDKEAWRYKRSKSTKVAVGASFSPEALGTDVSALLEEWSEPLEKARAAAAKKAAKAAKKAKTKSTVVDLGGAARHIIPYKEGFAALVRNEVVLFAKDGTVGERDSCLKEGEDSYAFRATGLTALEDGRLAIAGDYSKLVRILDANGAWEQLELNADEEQVWVAPQVYGRANSGTPIALSDSVVVMTPPKYPPSGRVVVLNFDTGEVVGEASGKGEIEETFRVNEDAIVGLAFGAQGKKLHAYRDLRTKPRYEAVGGHKKAINGVAIHGNTVATWSQDGTTRIVDLS